MDQNISGIVKFVDQIKLDNCREIMVTEYMPTGNLGSYIENSVPLNDVEILDIMHTLIKTVAYLHKVHGKTHRDIKL